MSEETDFSAAVSKLQEMLGSDDGKQMLENIASMFGDGASDTNANDTSSSNTSDKNVSSDQSGDFNMFDVNNIEMMMKLQKIISAMQSTDVSKQAGFLKSLGALLRPEKRDKVNNAIKLLGVGKAIEVFKNM